MTFFYKFWKKALVYYTLSISRGGGGTGPPPGFATELHWGRNSMILGVASNSITGVYVVLKMILFENMIVSYINKHC